MGGKRKNVSVNPENQGKKKNKTKKRDSKKGRSHRSREKNHEERVEGDHVLLLQTPVGWTNLTGKEGNIQKHVSLRYDK